MDDAATVKEVRRVLRLVQEHLFQAHINLGAEHESVGFVNVLHHPENRLPHLNYVTPRQKTAWIPAPEIERGINRLHELGRVGRVSYIEGLYPPLFAKALRELGLVIEREMSIMTYKIDGVQKVTLPEDITLEEVKSHASSALWWYVWRNAYFDVLTHGVEPLLIGRSIRDIVLGNQVDIIFHQHGFPIGVTRLTLHNNETAHIAAFAIMKEVRTPSRLRHLYQVTRMIAYNHGCKLIFTAGETELDRRLCREIGFVDMGSIVSYVEAFDEINKDSGDELLAQPVFVLR